MKIKEFVQQLFAEIENTPEYYTNTCDTLKAGDPEREVSRVATAMFATPEVIRAAGAWGADLLIVHEPVFYDHFDDLSHLAEKPEPYRTLIRSKLALIEENHLTIYRCHDHLHHHVEDFIALGEISRWGLKGRFVRGACYAVNEFLLDEPMPVAALVEALQESLNIRKIRLFGSAKTVCRKLGLCFGTPGHLAEELFSCDAVLTGEICEWKEGEMARDYPALLGKEKSILVMGHIGSERDGMRLLADFIREKYPQLSTQYFECGESFV